jgi:hypothetical protein
MPHPQEAAMLIKTNPVDRRRMLRGMLNGAAVTVSLPFLDIFLNENGTALAATGPGGGTPLPSRFGTWFWGLGVDPNIFTPSSVGALKDLPLQLQPIDKVKQYVNVLTNFDVLTDGSPNLCHYTGWVALRTGATPPARGILPGASLDTAIADVIGGGTRFKSLQMAATGGPRDTYSFRSADAINPPEISAVELYRKIFGPDFQDPNSGSFTPDPRIMTRQSVLSAVSAKRQDFERNLGAADKARLDQYYTSIREVENRLALQLEKPPAAPTCSKPGEPKEMPAGLDVGLVSARHRAMTDLLAMALVCNQTKVFNMVYSDSGSSLVRQGLEKSHHAYTHEEPVDQATGRQPHSAEFVGNAMTEWGYFVEKLAATPEGDGNLLDRSLIYAHSDCQVAKVHSLTSVPMFTAGKLNGKVKAGQHIDGNAQAATRVGLTVQRLMGVPAGSWGAKSMATTQDIGEIIA